MNILSIETSTRHYSLAVSENGKILAQKNTQLKNVLSSSIIPAIDGILKKAGMPLKNIDCFAVGLGPGSFTSLRVGLSTVKGLAFASGKPVIGIPSLDAIAAGQKITDDFDICVLADAKRGLVYACIYEHKKGALKPKTPYLLCSLEELLKKINKNTHFTGDGVKLFKETIEKNTPAKVSFAAEKYWNPKARHVALLAGERLDKGQSDRADTLIPLYLYPDDCQVGKT